MESEDQLVQRTGRGIPSLSGGGAAPRNRRRCGSHCPNWALGMGLDLRSVLGWSPFSRRFPSAGFRWLQSARPGNQRHCRDGRNPSIFPVNASSAVRQDRRVVRCISSRHGPGGAPDGHAPCRGRHDEECECLDQHHCAGRNRPGASGHTSGGTSGRHYICQRKAGACPVGPRARAQQAPPLAAVPPGPRPAPLS